MNSSKLLAGLRVVVPAVIVGTLLGGCDRHPKPDLDDVRSALQVRYGECPLWTLSDVRRIDGAPNADGYEISYSFVLTVKDPGTLTGHGTNVSKQDAMHIAASMFGDSSDPCFYGLFPLATVASQREQPWPQRYQGSGDRVFVRSEQGWHLNTVPPNPRDPATYDQFSPIADTVSAASPGSDVDGATAASAVSGGNNATAAASAVEASALPPAVAAATLASGPEAGDGTASQAGANAAPALSSSVVVSSAAEPASTVLPAAQPAAHARDVSDLEGDWRGTYQCGPYIGQGSVPNPDAWTAQITMTVHNGQAAGAAVDS